MNFFERKLRRTAPTGGDSRNVLVIPPLHARVNGWSLPLHGFQVIGWLVFGYMAAVGFGIYIPLLPPPWNHAAYCVIGTAFFFHFVTHLAAVSIDPADSSVRARKNYSNPMPVLDKRKHPHVIHNLHCYLCEVDVGSKVKHCSNCNKCISDFDHHCKWLNNCVGGRNYWFFFVTVASAVLGVLLLAFVILFVFIEHFLNPQNLRTAAQFYSVRGNGTWLVFLPLAPLETNSAGILVPAFITVMLCVVSFLLLCHLLAFHIYLLTKNMSTYEYIVRQRRTQSSGEPAATSITNHSSLQNLPPVEMSIDCDAPLSGRASALKYDKGPLNSRFSGGFCAEMDSFKQAAGDPEVAIQYGSKSSSQTLPGEVVMEDSLNWRPSRMYKAPGLEESGAGLVEESGAGLVEESGAGLVEGVPVVQNPLGSSVMKSTAVHQQLLTEGSWRADAYLAPGDKKDPALAETLTLPNTSESSLQMRPIR